MGADDATVLDGFLEEGTVPGDLHGHTDRVLMFTGRCLLTLAAASARLG
ncbi:hypothetical protein [Streptomyces sp. UH6]|nr:hypothetical protein [Streptomyces sp. UH6]NYV73290.1 hypothetical protein [Streptomyces sp. UH6]